MSYPINIRESAFLLYSNGKGGDVIARELGINKDTVYRWIKEENWEERKKKNQEEIQKDTNEKVIDRDKRQLQIIQANYVKHLEALKSGKITPRTGEIKQLMEIERLIAGLDTQRVSLSMQKEYESWFKSRPEKK